MDFSFSAEQETIRSAVEKICSRFGDDYWLAKDRDGGFPDDFHRAFAEAGWLGVCIPQDYGGAGPRRDRAAPIMPTTPQARARALRGPAAPPKIFWVQPGVVVWR